MSMPTPRPEMSVSAAAVEKPDAKISPRASRSDRALAAAGVSSPLRTADSFRCAGSMPLPSSVISMTTWFSSCRADRVTSPCAGFPASRSGFGRLDAVVHRVPQQVDQRVAQRLQDRAVQFGVPADGLKADFFAGLLRQVAHHARQALEDAVDGQHPRLHDLVLKLGRDAGDAMGRFQKLGRFLVARVAPVQAGADPVDLRALDDQLAHQVQQGVQPGDFHPDRLRLCPARLARRGLVRRVGRLRRRVSLLRP